MATSMKSLGIDQLPLEDRLSLAEEIWDSIASDPAAFPLNHTQRAELDRRIADYQARPETAIAWTEVKESLLARLRQ